MSFEYLGNVNGICTLEQLRKLTSFTRGTDFATGDIEWLKFNVGGKIILISSKVIVFRNLWSDLNDLGLVLGKEIRINDTDYICRLMTGGNSNPSTGPGGEWDMFFLDPKFNQGDLEWNELQTQCQETVIGNQIVSRGKESIDYYYDKYSIGTTSALLGWRPVLEMKKSYPHFSIKDLNLGDILTFTSKNYTVTDLDIDDSFSIVEKLDTSIIRTLENQTSGTQYTLDLSDVWGSIGYGKHTIEIIATDTNGLSSTVTITFNKIKEPIITLSTTSSLKQAIEHNKEIDKEIDYQLVIFEEILKEKGIEVLPSEKKMSTLIDKVGSIELGKKWASGIRTGVINSKLSIRGLGFRPSMIGAYNSKLYPNTVYYSFYSKKIVENFPEYSDKAVVVSTGQMPQFYNSVTIYEDGFDINLSRTDGDVYWIAYE